MNLREINSNDPSVLDGRTNDSSRTKFRALPRHTTKEIITKEAGRSWISYCVVRGLFLFHPVVRMKKINDK
ncbi:unnamed protein product [Larinioides sclopetarius]|uniref:Uncharacterized protein n=1 Tax=Larinioides sclopetarius TaxID=280406 RepID=A0AAV1ZRZ4_9ARAC